MFGNSEKSFIYGLFKGKFGPRFNRGDIRLVLLELLLEKQRHGYELIQELEHKFSGCYSPSSGTIYPTLQLLEDQNLIISQKTGGKKIYTITAEGETYIKENKATFDEMTCRIGSNWGQQLTFITEIKHIFSTTGKQLHTKLQTNALTDTQKEAILQTCKQCASDIEKIIR